MELESTQTSTTAKLPMLKQVAETTTDDAGTSTIVILGLVTTEEKSKKKNDVKARIETRFGRNEATKKTQNTLLKQLYENFSATCTESLDSIFNRLQKLASHPNSTNEVHGDFGVSTASSQVSTTNLSDSTVYAFLENQPNGSQLVHKDLEQIHEDDLKEMDLKWQLALLSMRAKRFFQMTKKKITINGSDTAGYDKSKVECFNCHKMRHFARECRSYMADDKAPTNMAFMALLDSEKLGVKISAPIKENNGAPLIKDWESDEEDEVESLPEKERKTVEPSVDKVEVKIPKQNDKPARRPVKYAEMYITQRLRGNQRNWNNFKSHQLGSNFVMYNKACHACRSFTPLQARCKYHQRERMVNGTNHSRVNHNANTVPKAMLTRTGLKPVNFVRPVNPKINFQRTTTYNNKNFFKKVNTANEKVNTARPNSAVLNAIMANNGKSVKALACWVWRPIKLDSASIVLKTHTYIDAQGRCKSVMAWVLKKLMSLFHVQGHSHKQIEDQGYFNSGCSWHMTGNISYLIDFKEIDRGYVAFGRRAKGGKITSKGIIRTATKDETSRILKSFINEIENLVDKKVKIIRCDNETEFKNRVMNDFCNEKGDGPKWLFDIDTLTKSMNYVPVIAASDGDKQDNDGPSTKSEIDNQERPNDEHIQQFYTVRQSDDFFGAEDDLRSLDEVELDISNISTTYPVPTTLNTRINKDHSLDNVIGDIQSGVQTRRMTVTTDKQGFIIAIYDEKTHEDLHTCLSSCFLSHEEPKRIT
nr:hypothetical protein [Tanacetum cinerariifolium]